MGKKNENFLLYNKNSLIVSHVFTGFISNGFKIVKNEADLTDRQIAKILNDDWYGKENEVKFRTFKNHRKKIIVIIENYFPEEDVSNEE